MTIYVVSTDYYYPLNGCEIKDAFAFTTLEQAKEFLRKLYKDESKAVEETFPECPKLDHVDFKNGSFSIEIEYKVISFYTKAWISECSVEL